MLAYVGTAMQTRPYPERDGLRIWLSRSEQSRLLDGVDEYPQRRIGIELALHGLRSDEIVETDGGPGVEYQHIRQLTEGADGRVLVINDGKTGRREVPLNPGLGQRCDMFKNATGRRQDRALVDVSTRTLRNWMEDARAVLKEPAASELGMHDLRRTFATDAYYSLAFAGVPIAEQLVMSYGGWRQTETGRDTFRENYLGPVPDHITAQAREHLPMVDAE
jgi:integrase